MRGGARILAAQAGEAFFPWIFQGFQMSRTFAYNGIYLLSVCCKVGYLVPMLILETSTLFGVIRIHKHYSLPLSLGTGMNGKIGILSSLNDLFYHYNEGAQGQGPPILPFLKFRVPYKAANS